MTAAAGIRSEARNGGLSGLRRRPRVDVIGLVALLLAVVGLAATLGLTQTRRTATSAASVAVAPAPPSRDDWYLGQFNPGTPGSDVDALTNSVVQNRAARVRDQWYLDQAAGAAPVSGQARDRWYLDRGSASDPPKDRWYTDGGYPTR